MALIRCNACKGMKNIMGMGMVTKKCDTCDGVGYVKEQPTTPKENLKELITELQADIMNDKQEIKHARKATQKEKSS